MGYETQLSFVRQLLEAYRIPNQIVSEPEKVIPASIDRGLRSALFGVETYNSILQHSMAEAKENTIYRFYDAYSCRYIFMKLPDAARERYFFIGPYLVEALTKRQAAEIARRMELPGAAQRFLTLYYEDLPVIQDENWLLTLAQTLGKELWQDSEQFSLEYIDYMIPAGATRFPLQPLPFN